MKCDFCNQELLETWQGKLAVQNRGGKYFCDFKCLESFYIQTIDKLTKSEKAWHNEWFKQAEIIGRLGCFGCKSIDERYAENKSRNNLYKLIEKIATYPTQHECNCDCHDPNQVVMHCMPCCHECDICGIRVLDERSHNKQYHKQNKCNCCCHRDIPNCVDCMECCIEQHPSNEKE